MMSPPHSLSSSLRYPRFTQEPQSLPPQMSASNIEGLQASGNEDIYESIYDSRWRMMQKQKVGKMLMIVHVFFSFS